MTSEAILFEVGGWLIMACLALIVVLLFLKLISKFRLVFAILKYLTMPGTIIHEAGHYLACKLYGFQVVEVKWFHWGYMLNYEKAIRETNRRRGYVHYVDHRSNIFVLFQVNAAPLLSCGLLWLLCIIGVHLLISETSPFSAVLIPLQETVAVLILLWIGLASASRMLPSDIDMRNVLGFESDSPLKFTVKAPAWMIQTINRMLYRSVGGVFAWGAITALTTLIVLLQFSVPGGRAYLEPFGIIAAAIRDFADAAKSVN